MASFQVLCVFLQSFITAELQVSMNIYHSCHVLLPTGHPLPANTHSHVVVLVLELVLKVFSCTCSRPLLHFPYLVILYVDPICLETFFSSSFTRRLPEVFSYLNCPLILWTYKSMDLQPYSNWPNSWDGFFLQIWLAFRAWKHQQRWHSSALRVYSLKVKGLCAAMQPNCQECQIELIWAVSLYPVFLTQPPLDLDVCSYNWSLRDKSLSISDGDPVRCS